MNTTNFIYPANPVNVAPSITQPSATFKKEISAVMGSIILFLIVYLIMFVLSIGLVIGCVYAGFAIIINIPKFITILIGAGLIGLGIMVFVFLIKFLFAVNRFNHSGSIEIREEEQPRLFAFIRRLTKDTQTPFPKKIYLSPDVNACVFYDSSFWSMFLPVRKNLQIGLGLVNSINISEFKAVMAHEFGHFSQRSMKLGSFVYNVNKIIHNMLFENNSYGNFLNSWASVGNTFAFFATVTAKIANGIQWVLRQMYGVINKSYMGLSREMEFHADAVAASVSGSKSLITALRRVELADTGYNITLQKCDELFKEKKISNNIYQNQRVVLKHLAEDFKLPMQYDMPVVSNEFLESNNLARVNFKNQWASHPSTDDREKHLKSLSVEAEILEEPAWVLFDNKEQLQARLTQKIYETVVQGKEVVTIENNEFEGKFYTDINQFTLPEAYNGFYDNRQVTLLDIETVNAGDQDSTKSFTDIFSIHNASLHKKINAIGSDIEVLKAIEAKNIYTKSFDFDGVKYDREDAASIVQQLEKEKQDQQQQLEQLDKSGIALFISKATAKSIGLGDELKNMYSDYFEQRRKADEFLKQMNEMLESVGPIYAGQTIPIDDIRLMIGTLKDTHEHRFRGWLKAWMALGVFDKKAGDKAMVEKFINSNFVYFSGSSFFESELGELNSICNESWTLVNNFIFTRFKAILEKQLPLLNY